MRRCSHILLLSCMPLAAWPAGVLELDRLPLPAALPPLVQDAAAITDAVPPPVPRRLAAEVRRLLRQHRDALERDRRGMPIMRAVIVALSPDPQALARALERGYVLQDDRALEGIGARLVTLLVPRGVATEAALRELRAADPDGQYDFDHLFVESAAAAALPAVAASPATALPPTVVTGVRVGLIDAGVDARHPVFRRRPPHLSGCNGQGQPSVHGTAVASLFVGWSEEFSGAAPGAELHAFDVYCGDGAPGGRVRDVVAALGGLAAAQVRVINMSIVGPDNAVLGAAVRAVQARDILIVAATGNDGPHAKPLYPAAWPGVIAVSAVDARQRVLAEASGGAHVSFTAPGADLLAAVPGGRFQSVRGTSFAAPLVAGMLARELAVPGMQGPAIVERLAAAAEDRGARGRDPRYGYGLVGADLAPALMGNRAGP